MPDDAMDLNDEGVEAASIQDMIADLDKALHGRTWARPQTPKQVWEELLDEVARLRAVPESDAPRMSAEVEAILDRRNHRDLLLADALKDLCWKATPFTTDDAESITSYIVPAGTLHRLAGQAQQFAADFKVTVAFRAVAALSPDEAAGGE